MNQELSDVQGGFRKGRRTRDQIANICWIMEKAREFQKTIYFYFIDYIKTFSSVDYDPASHSLAYTLRKLDMKETCAPQCSLQHCL